MAHFNTSLHFPGGLYISYRDGRPSANIHNLTRERFDALTTAFTVLREPHPVDTEDREYFLTACIDFGGLDLGLFTETFARPDMGTQMELAE